MANNELSGYEKKFDEDVTSFNDYEATDYVRTLKNDGKLDEAIEVGSTFYSMCPNLRGYINQYGYALYNKHINLPINEISEKESLFFSFAKDILEMCKQEKYSPYEATVNKMIKYVTSKSPIDYKKYNELLSLLDPKLLSSEAIIIKERNQEGESHLERWYRQKVKVLFELEKYKDCIVYANNALASVKKWHYRNLQWIKYYRACSNIKLGEYNEGQKDFLALQGQIKDINFYEVLYETYASLDQDKKANTFLIYDLYMSGYDISKVKLFENLLKASQKINYDKLSSLIEIMLYKIKLETNQKTDPMEDPYPTENSGDLYDRMMDELTGHLDKFIERYQGKVMYYNNDREIGNILTAQQDMLFFRQADYIYDEEVKRYDVVEYSVLPTYDRKKDAETNKAVLITLLYEDINY